MFALTGPGGSTGKVIALRTDGPFKNDPAPLVEWTYGRDAYGEPIHEKSYFYGDEKEKLVEITEAEYLAVHNRKFNEKG